MNRKILLLSLMIMSVLTSCGPSTYYVTMERRVVGKGNVDFSGTLPGVLVMGQYSQRDSLLVSSLAAGVAGGMEMDLGIDSGIVPVYFLKGANFNEDPSVTPAYLHDVTGVDKLVLIDRFKVGDFTVTHPAGRAFVDGHYRTQTKVLLPYSLRTQVLVREPQDTVLVRHGDDILEWTLLSDEEIPNLKAIEKASESLYQGFMEIGQGLAFSVMPQWRTEQKRIYCYTSGRWYDAYYLAAEFRWNEALEIWLKEVKTSNGAKAACAAHNISVACEVLGMEEKAAEWSAYSKKMFDRYW